MLYDGMIAPRYQYFRSEKTVRLYGSTKLWFRRRLKPTTRAYQLPIYPTIGYFFLDFAVLARVRLKTTG